MLTAFPPAAYLLRIHIRVSGQRRTRKGTASGQYSLTNGSSVS